ncbi:hypothetical protein G7046_g8063 [Stylonectria norvegica]|nr:hypothetical protein G7046_g8063 [Stylonectria norvegica]
MASSNVIHDAASKGFDNAASYDAHRPSYPDAAVSSLLDHLELAGKPRSKVLDLAAGTGKFTELLAARPEDFEIVAVEPLGPMRQTLAEKHLKGVEVRGGTAAKIDTVESGWADGVVVAQAFHWFAKEEALQEIHRVLKPGAKLGLIWNVEDYNRPRSWPVTTKWEQELNELSFSVSLDEQPRFRHDVWHQVFDRQAKADTPPLFATPIATERLPWSVWLTLEGLWERLDTLSWIAILEGEERRAFKDKFEKIVKEGDAKWNDKGEIEFHGCTFFAWTTRV